MAMMWKNQNVKNGEKMKKLRKNGMRNGEKYTDKTKNKNGAINGK
jgi:hypothetical protein